jgi:esterase/lipase
MTNKYQLGKMTKSKTVALCIAGLTLFGIVTAFGGLRQAEDGAVSMPTGSTVISQPAAGDLAEDQPENHSIRWFNSPTAARLKGVALVIHGLNLRPERMQPIIDNLTRHGIDVLSLSLRGHGENYAHRDDMDAAAARLETFKHVSYPLWTDEAYLAYRQVQKRAQQQQIPVFLTAFSTGGLIGLDLMVSNPDVHYDRIVLLAPAISLRATIYLQRVLTPFPNLVIPSLADEAYLANIEGTPVAAYNALFDALYHFEDTAGPKLNVPTLIFIDEQDEFIPLGGLKKLAVEHKLDKWQFYIVQKEEEMAAGTFHHHIIDASSTGEGVWQDMMSAAVKHLLGNKPE